MQRLDILRMHIEEGKTVGSIVLLYKDRGVTIPRSTLYSMFSKQAKGESVFPQHTRHKRTTYTDDDRNFIVQAQTDHNEWTYDQLRKAWKEQHPDTTHKLSNDTIHRWLDEADITTKRLVPVPVGRNEEKDIEARRVYSLEAITWHRNRLIFLDETSFDRGLHSNNGRSKKGTLATLKVLNSAGPGLKVCAAVSPVLGLVMYEPQLTAWNGPDFARFITRLCALDAVKQQSMMFVMDNVRVHHTEVVKDAIRGQSVQHDLKFLPTYSPHLNPIEYCFHNWKSEIKHINQLDDTRPLRQQIDDTRTCITDHLVNSILDHVFQLYAHCIQGKTLEEFKPIGHRVRRAQQEAALQRRVIAERAEQDEHKE